jgi:hypothetical protein
VFRNDACCYEQTVTVGPRQPPKELVVKLPWKPARVSVKLKPDVAADILVGNLVVRPGQPAEVPIPSYSENGRAAVEVKVSADGYLTETRKVTVRANTPREVKIALKKGPP